jgi:hypothetical protein
MEISETENGKQTIPEAPKRSSIIQSEITKLNILFFFFGSHDDQD